MALRHSCQAGTRSSIESSPGGMDRGDLASLPADYFFVPPGVDAVAEDALLVFA